MPTKRELPESADLDARVRRFFGGVLQHIGPGDTQFSFNSESSESSESSEDSESSETSENSETSEKSEDVGLLRSLLVSNPDPGEWGIVLREALAVTEQLGAAR